RSVLPELEPLPPFSQKLECKAIGMPNLSSLTSLAIRAFHSSGPRWLIVLIFAPNWMQRMCDALPPSVGAIRRIPSTWRISAIRGDADVFDAKVNAEIKKQKARQKLADFRAIAIQRYKFPE